MTREIIKDWYGKIIGNREERSNGDIYAHDFYGKLLGRYDKKMNVTKDFYGKILSSGDITTSLIWDAWRKKLG